jgi:phosphoribosyl 1,2-cyclic phosphodiesterase
MKLRFWGVRGSIPSPGVDTAGVGGNTSCVEVRCGGTRLVLDAGTGLRRLGDTMMAAQALDATLLLSHFHWDHIQGLPFFVPAYLRQSELRVVGMRGAALTLEQTLATQMQAPVFPVRFDQLGARLALDEITPGASFALGDVRVRTALLDHPGGSLGYRIEHGGNVVVYATDVELGGAAEPSLRALAHEADVLVMDAQYLPEEYRNAKVGWGHSTFDAVARLARESRVKNLVLFHHDPTRSDAGVAAIEAAARELFPRTIAAREGLFLDASSSDALPSAEPSPEPSASTRGRAQAGLPG